MKPAVVRTSVRRGIDYEHSAAVVAISNASQVKLRTKGKTQQQGTTDAYGPTASLGYVVSRHSLSRPSYMQSYCGGAS